MDGERWRDVPGTRLCTSCRGGWPKSRMLAVDGRWYCKICAAPLLLERLQEMERERDEAWDNALSSLLHRTVTWHSPAVARPTPALCVATEEQEIGREQVRDEARSMLRDHKLRDYWRSHGAAAPEERKS